MTESPASPYVSPDTADRITSPSPNDILLGRGSAFNEFVGNQRFRDMIDERRTEYTSYSQFAPKKKIAKEVLDKVHALGGRFLRLVESDQPVDSIIEEGVWEVVAEKVALDKVKQGLREKNRPKRKKQGPVIEKALLEAYENSKENSTPPLAGASTEFVTPTMFGGPGNVAPTMVNAAPLQVLPSGFSMAMQPPMFLGSVPPSMAGVFPNTSFVPLHQQKIFGQPLGLTDVGHGQLPDLYGRSLAANALRTQEHIVAPRRMDCTRPQSVKTDTGLKNGGAHQRVADEATVKDPTTRKAAERSSSLGGEPAGSSADKHDAFLALSALSVADRPRFSEEQESLEKESLTMEERADILTDMFGKRCNVTPRQNKKARKDLDRESIDFLIKFMRSEIERTPDEKKQALLEAQSKGEEDEFSDERLESFLRCEGMNAKLAAQRFICYWEDRKSVFGTDKFTLSMTLSGALRDDLVAIEAGVYVQLPNRDTSGRQVLWMDPHRHTKQGYSSESLLRAYWYLFEVASRENNDVGRGYVNVVWDKKSTLWDYDRHVYDSITRFEKSSWPVRVVAHHICCAPKFNAAIMKPIFFFVADKFTRSRTKFHDVPESEIIESLSDYGIIESMLPTEMGGSVQFSQTEWIAKRRAAEMEEIA